VHAAAGAAAARAGRTCQADFYADAHHVERGELADARALLQSAIGKCRYGLIESGAPRLELKRLERLSAAKPTHRFCIASTLSID
jgi:hypothetical protein